MLLDALLGLAFATATRLKRLTLQHTTTRRIIMQKARHHTGLLHSALTVCRHTVSGSISLPSRGSFHHSLTVLSAIGGKEYLALDGGPPRFTQGYSCPALLGS